MTTPGYSVNQNTGNPGTGGGGGCGDEDKKTESLAWSLDIGEADYTITQNLLSYSRSGALQGRKRGGKIAGFSTVYRAYNDNSTSKHSVLLTLEEKTITAAIANPAVLELNNDFTTAEVIRNGSIIRQVKTYSVFTDVSPLSSGAGFTIKTWDIASIPTLVKSSGFYTLPSQTPYYSVTFFNPDYPNDLNRIDKTVIENTGNSVRSITERFEETFLPSPNHTIPNTFTISTYQGADTTGTLVHREFIQYSDRGTGTISGPASVNNTRRYWDYNIERTISEASLSASGTLGALQVISHTFEQFKDFSVYTGTTEPDLGGDKAARRMISETVGFSTPEARTTTYVYHNQPSNNFLHGRLTSQTNSDGSWECYEYSDTQNSSVATETKWSSWKDVTLANKENAIKTVTTIETSKKTSVTTIVGQQVAKDEILVENLPDGSIQTTTRNWSGAEWAESITYRHTQDNAPLTSGRTKWEEHSDGTATTYTYATVAGGYSVTTSKGAGDRNGITAGTRSVAIYNGTNILLSQETYDIGSNLQLAVIAHSDFDNKGRPQRTDYPLDGTYEIRQYSCCGLGFSRDRSGATANYLRDPLKRVYRLSSKRSSAGNEVVSSSSYDGLTTTNTSTAGSATLFMGESTRNLAGETIQQKSPDANGDSNPEISTMLTTYPVGGGQTVTMTYPDSTTTSATSFIDGSQKSSTDQLGNTTTQDKGTHNLNGGGTWSQTTAPNGTQWTKSYSDSLGRSFRSELADAALSTQTYHPFSAAAGSRGKTATATDPDGVTTTYAYDAEGDLSQTNEQMPAAQQRSTLTVNDVVTDPGIGISARQRTTVNGILVSTSLSQAIGYASKSVTLSGTSTSIRTVPNNGAWTVTSTAPDGTDTRATHTDGLMKKQEQRTTADTVITFTEMTHDAFGRTLTQTDSRTGTTTMGTILESGAYTSVTDPGGRTTSWTYDVMGRTLTTDLPDTLDADGNTLTNITENSYTLRGETAATWGAQTNPTFNIYDSQGRMSELRTYKTLTGEPTAATPDSASTTWQYHPQRGFLTAKRDAENKGADYTYTPAGRLATRTWARSSVAGRIATTYTYNAGMLTLTDYSDTTPDVAISYDNFGRVLSSSTLITDHSALITSSTYLYDAATLVLDTETVSHDLDANGTPELTRVIDRSQDALLRDTGFQLKDGAITENQASYSYGATDGRLSTVSGGGLNPPSQFTYSYLPNSNLLETITGPAHTVTNAWEATRNVLESKENKAGATVVSDYGYTVNAIGQRTALSQSGSAFAATRSVDWGYDSLGQVTKADSTIPGLDRAYQFDLIGNRLKSADSLTLPTAPNYTSNALNQYTAIDSLTPSYDDDGNMTSGPLPANLSANSTLTWDAENRMISSTVGATTTTYRYDAGSRRIAKTTNGAATLYIYDGWNPIAEYSSPNLQSPISHVRSFLWGMDLSGSMQGAGGVGGLLSVSEISNSQISNYYPTFDGNGNVSEYLDSAGAIAAHYEYDPFGRTTVATGAKAQDFSHRFSTKPLDAETGLYYYGYRYYDPVTGRWPSRDPIEEQGGTNLYGFVGNDGVNGWDFLGMRWQPFANAEIFDSFAGVRIEGDRYYVYRSVSKSECSTCCKKVQEVRYRQYALLKNKTYVLETKVPFARDLSEIAGVYGAVLGGAALMPGPHSPFAGTASGILGLTAFLADAYADAYETRPEIRYTYMGDAIRKGSLVSSYTTEESSECIHKSMCEAYPSPIFLGSLRGVNHIN